MRGFCGIGLHRAKTPSNVGMVLRASKCFGAEFVAVSGMRYSKSRTDPQKSFKSMPLFEVENLQSIIPFGATPVAVDLLPDARPIKNYVHPERAFYIFGPEDGTLMPDVTGYCRDKIYIPTEFCLNLAMAVNIVLFDRFNKGMK